MQKKSLVAWFMVSILCLSLFAPYPGKQVHAMTVLETDVTTPSSGCTFLGVYGTYYSQAQDALNRINEIRKEACEAGNVPDPRTPSRMLTPSDYVPIKWSTDLESVARIRAMEGGLAYSFMSTGHSRLNGKGWSSVTYNGVKSYAEDLAYNSGTSMVSGINQWYGEKSAWVNQVSGAVTGHYTSMINPNNTYVGLGDFYTEAAVFPNTLAGEFCSSTQNLNQTMQAEQKNIMQKVEVLNSYITGYVLEGTNTIYTDKTTTLTPKAILTNGSKTHRLWVLDSVTYTSSNTSVATVNNGGVVTGLKNGTTTITAKTGNNTLATVVVTVKCNHAKELKSETPPTCTSTGLKVYRCDTCGESMEQEVAMTAHDYIYGDADSNGYRTGTCSVCKGTIKIIPPSTMTLWWRNSTSTSNYYYSYFPTENPIGSTIYCWPDDVDGDSGYRDMIIESTDQSVISVPETAIANSSNNKLNVLAPGITTLTVYPKYNPSLKRTVVARIGDPGSVDFSIADVTLSQTIYEYSGVACKPTVTVSYHDTILRQGTDYTLSYENNIAIGTATVVIAGSGIFTGTVRKNFAIGHNAHSYGPWQITTEASCTNEGEKRRDCSDCDAFETEVIDMLEHEVVIDASVDATCTETGLTEGSHCLNCSTTIIEQSIVDAKGHTYVNGQCEDCGDIIYANINGLTYTVLDAEDGSLAVSIAAQESAILTGVVNIPSTIDLNGKEYRITTIEANAFAGQSQIVSLTVPATVTEIESQAFAQNSSLETVKFYGTTAPIAANDIFAGTSGVEMIVPENATGYDALAAKTGVALKIEHVHELIYHEAVEATCVLEGNMAYYTCEGCDAIYSDEFGNDEITIEDTILDATGHTYGEWEVTTEASCTNEGEKRRDCSLCDAYETEAIAMKDHEAITDVAVDATCTESGLTEGSHCLNCSTTIIEQSIVDAKGHTYVDGQCVNCDDIIYANINGLTYTILDTEDGSLAVSVAAQEGVILTGVVNIPSTIDLNGKEYRITTIEANAFAGQSQIVSLTVPATVTEIESQAFAQNSSLETVKFYGTTAPIASNDIFAGTSGVEMIVPENAAGYDALAAKTGVALKTEHVHDMTYHEALEATCVLEGNIAYYTCEGCDAIYSDEFGNNQLTLEETVIDAMGHSWDENYTIDVQATATTDGSKSIHCGQCSATKDHVVIPATGADEGDDGDDNSDSNDDKTYLTLGKTFKIKGITYKVVKSNPNEEKFEVSCIKTSDKKIKKYIMPKYVTYIGVDYQVVSVGKNAFKGCKKLKTLTLGSNVTTVGDKAFYKCTALSNVTIPSKVTKIGKQAFYGCKKLKTITVKSKKLKASKIGKNAFKGIKSNATVKVPKKKLKTYKAMLRKKGVSSKAKFKKL